MKYEEFICKKEPKSEARQKLNLLPKLCKKYPPHDACQHEITDELVSFIAGDPIPLWIVESPRFPMHSRPASSNDNTTVVWGTYLAKESSTPKRKEAS